MALRVVNKLITGDVINYKKFHNSQQLVPLITEKMIKVQISTIFTVIATILIFLTVTGEAVRCFQCSSAQDPKGQDNCGAYKKFDKTRHVAVECSSSDSHMPGSFCMKVVQQSPKGFIWDGRWRQVIRRCASVAETGVTGVCNWGVYENGVYWEQCYCSDDECNATNTLKPTLFGLCLIVMVTVLFY